MKNKNIDNIDEVLASINKVEANPFLLTRIQEKLKQSEVASKPFVWALGFSFLLVLAINLVGFTNTITQEGSTNAVEEFNYLLPENGLYD